jgi:hypothetical protein
MPPAQEAHTQMNSEKPRVSVTKGREKKPQRKERLSLYPLTIEDALQAAAKTGRSAPLSETERPKRQRKKPTKPG